MTQAFSLEVQAHGIGILKFDLPGKTVNIFNEMVLAELSDLVAQLSDRRDIRCLVLLSTKPETFIAGADLHLISSVTDPSVAAAGIRLGQQLFQCWEDLPFPTVAAIRGACIAAGTELALASTHILISDRRNIRIGLPEVQLGILPAWGGCTRLPLRIGIQAALDIILAGKTIPPRKALRIGLVDELLPDANFHELVWRFAQKASNSSRRKGSKKKKLATLLLEENFLGRKILFDQARKQVLKKTRGHYPAPLRALEVVRAGVEHGAAEGFLAEARAASELAVSPLTKNLLHVFELIEASKRDSSDPGEDSAQPTPIDRAAVIGAGAMGGGIAHLFADRADIPVRLKEIGHEPLAKGMGHAAALFQAQVKRRRLSTSEAKRKLNLIRPTLDYTGFERSDIVIEAVVEDLEIKRRVLEDVSARVGPEAILATNTSSILIDSISETLANPSRVVGLHFFNPVHKMPLVEIVAGNKTSQQTIQAVLHLVRRLGKTPVVVNDGPGFLVNRLLMFSMAEALWLLDEGVPIDELDNVMKGWGMPMGPISLTDEVGIDVAVKVAHIVAAAFSDRLILPKWIDRMIEDSRLGKKTGRGFYRYERGKRSEPDPEVYELLGLTPRPGVVASSEIVDRLVLPMVNEAARCLAEGIVEHPNQVDLAMIMGTGFPPFHGGLCRWADTQGLSAVRDGLVSLQQTVGERFRVSEALEDYLKRGGFYLS